MSNRVISWNVNCTDDSQNRNTGTATARSLVIAVDDTPPRITLLNPQNNYTDTDRNVTFNYSVSDDFTSTADCTLYINKTANTTQENVPTDGRILNVSNLTFFNNDSFSWYINCTDKFIKIMHRAHIVRRELLYTVKYDEELASGEDMKYSRDLSKYGRYFFIHTDQVITSARRFLQKGYAKMFFINMKSALPKWILKHSDWETIR